jgi:hypothetical protein
MLSKAPRQSSSGTTLETILSGLTVPSRIEESAIRQEEGF